MSDNQKSQAKSIFEHLGGKLVAPPMPVQTEKPIDFSAVGGKRVLDQPITEPAESV